MSKGESNFRSINSFYTYYLYNTAEIERNMILTHRGPHALFLIFLRSCVCFRVREGWVDVMRGARADEVEIVHQRWGKVDEG